MGRPIALVVTDRPVGMGFPDGFAGRYDHFLRALADDFVIDLVLMRGQGHERAELPARSFPVRSFADVARPPIRLAGTGWRRWARRAHYVVGRLPRTAGVRSPAVSDAIARDDVALVVLLLYPVAQFALTIPKRIPVVTALEERPEVEPGKEAPPGGIRSIPWHAKRRQERNLYRRVGRRVQAAVAINDDERAWWRARCPARRFEVVPHAIDVEYYEPQEAAADFDVTAVGVFKWNREMAIVDFHRALARRSADEQRRIRALVVGPYGDRAARLLRAEDIDLTGEVPDVRPYYARSKVVVVPARMGSGTKTTVMEAWAMARPVVATPFAASTLPARHGENILIGETDDDLADHVISLLESPELATRIGGAGRGTAVAERNVERTREQFAVLCRDVAGLTPRTSSR
jgi:glycosyltransferase involved in cell wall biosynthesis